MRATLFAAILPLAFAYPNRRSVREWAAPGPSDSRAPCPGLNTLANHGYLPHDGRNLTVSLIAAAANEALNWDLQVGTLVAGTTFRNLGVEVLDLELLGTPDVTEHTSSLTRLDAELGDPIHLNLALLEDLLADSDGEYLDITSLGRSRARVESLSPSGPLQEPMNNVANLEAGSILTTFPEKSDWVTGEHASLRAPKNQVRAWLTEERFPTELGWQRSIHKLSLADLSPLGAAVQAAKKL